jgi:hypothetical protein
VGQGMPGSFIKPELCVKFWAFLATKKKFSLSSQHFLLLETINHIALLAYMMTV